MTYSGLSLITQRTSTNSAYDWSAAASANTAYQPNGLNQLTVAWTPPTSAPTFLSSDARGNMTADGSGRLYSYDSENHLACAFASTCGTPTETLSYDPLGRLYQTVAGGVTRRFLYDGADIIAEYDGSSALQERYVHGPWTDEPEVHYHGSGTSDRRYLLADERGSIIAEVPTSGSVTKYTYDPFGAPAAGSGRFGFTGQAFLSEIALYYYKARIYSARLGRFPQPDPILYDADPHLYAYVENDPINYLDPRGLFNEELLPLGDLALGNAFLNSLNTGEGQVAPGVQTIIVTADYYNPLVAQCTPLCMMFGGPIATGSGFTYSHQMFRAGAVGGGISAPLAVGASAASAGLAVSAPDLAASAADLGPVVAEELGPSGSIFGRASRGGSSLLRINANKFIRIGWGWKGSATAGQDVFRISGEWVESLGVESGHIDIYSNAGGWFPK